MAGRVVDRALQVLGGRGYMRENPVERLYRDLRVDRIWEGTSEIQRVVVANELVKRGAGGGHRVARVVRPSVERERRVQLTSAAARVIARKGYEAATLRDVADEAGTSTGTLNYYYHGKDDLFARDAARGLRALPRPTSARRSPRRARRATSCVAMARAATPVDARGPRGARAVDRLLGAGRPRRVAARAERADLRPLARRDRRRSCARDRRRARSRPTPIPRRSRAATRP